MGDPLRLYGLNALVLNAGSGIGEAIARTLIKHGATVIAADTSNSGVEQHYRSVKGITGVRRKPDRPGAPEGAGRADSRDASAASISSSMISRCVRMHRWKKPMRRWKSCCSCGRR